MRRPPMTDEECRCADEDVRKNLPPGVKLVRTLRGHADHVGRIAWSPDGRMLASPSADGTIRLWDAETGECLRTRGLGGTAFSAAWSPDGLRLAAGTGEQFKDNNCVQICDAQTLSLVASRERLSAVRALSWSPSGTALAVGLGDGSVHILRADTLASTVCMNGHQDIVNGVLWLAQGHRLVSASGVWGEGRKDNSIRVWYPRQGTQERVLTGHSSGIYSIAWNPEQRILASASCDSTVGLWDVDIGGQIGVLERHAGNVKTVAFSARGDLLASIGEDVVLLWDTAKWTPVAAIPAETCHWLPVGLAYHPHLPLLATVGSDPGTPEDDSDRLIHIYELDLAVLLGQEPEPAAHYVNAKVVLVGDTGVGKSGLSLVLNNQPYKETDSTAGRHVWTLGSRNVPGADGATQTRETLLWDLAGQPGYRVVHQLHLNEVAVALVVFDARSETDPLAGVRHWERALRLARQRQGTSGVPMKKLLVSARNDRGSVSVGEERLQALLKEFDFDGYFKTSAKEGWQIEELGAAIERAIPWDDLPVVSSSQLFADIKAFLLEVKATARLLAPAGELYDQFAGRHPDTGATVPDLREQFGTCIRLLENRDLIRRLTFGGCVLLQPELLDAYASAMVNAAKEEPDGLGSLAEEIALAGRFFVPGEHRVADPGQEQMLLHATVQELVRHDLALRENADDGRYLVFPSQFNRDYEDAPEPQGKAVAITFDGPVQSLYSTLAVRLGHSGLFTTGRAQMWRNAAVFTAKAGGKCGLFLQEFAEARGRLILFFPDGKASAETRFHFEGFTVAHTRRRSLDDTVTLIRFFVCPECGEPVPDAYVKMLRSKAKTAFNCPCGGTVPLREPAEQVHFRSEVEAMDRTADRHRDYDAFLVSAKGETTTAGFREWAGGQRVTLAVVFTDVVGSTALGEELRDEAMNEVRRAHFAQSRRLIERFGGREIKTIGDSFMAAFKCADAALDYALALHRETGHRQVRIRAGMHVGPLQVEEGDVFGGTVNFAARVIGAIQGAEIWMSAREGGRGPRGRPAAQRPHLGAARRNPHERLPRRGHALVGQCVNGETASEAVCPFTHCEPPSPQLRLSR